MRAGIMRPYYAVGPSALRPACEPAVPHPIMDDGGARDRLAGVGLQYLAEAGG